MELLELLNNINWLPNAATHNVLSEHHQLQVGLMDFLNFQSIVMITNVII